VKLGLGRLKLYGAAETLLSLFELVQIEFAKWRIPIAQHRA
jgi:hypothetical protein